MDEHNVNRSESAPNARFEDGRYYRPGDAALSVIASRGTLATWRWQGRGPRYTKFGHRILYLGADLNAWLDARVVEPTIRTAEDGGTPRGGRCSSDGGVST